MKPSSWASAGVFGQIAIALILLGCFVVFGRGFDVPLKAFYQNAATVWNEVVVTESSFVFPIERVSVFHESVDVEKQAAAHKSVILGDFYYGLRGQGEGILWNEQQVTERNLLVLPVLRKGRKITQGTGQFCTDPRSGDCGRSSARILDRNNAMEFFVWVWRSFKVRVDHISNDPSSLGSPRRYYLEDHRDGHNDGKSGDNESGVPRYVVYCFCGVGFVFFSYFSTYVVFNYDGLLGWVGFFGCVGVALAFGGFASNLWPFNR